MYSTNATKRPEPDVHDGAHLDTAIALKDLTAAEQAQVAALKEKAKADIRPEANAVKINSLKQRPVKLNRARHRRTKRGTGRTGADYS